MENETYIQPIKYEYHKDHENWYDNKYQVSVAFAEDEYVYQEQGINLEAEVYYSKNLAYQRAEFFTAKIGVPFIVTNKKEIDAKVLKKFAESLIALTNKDLFIDLDIDFPMGM